MLRFDDGWDPVELIMAIEDRFNLSIPEQADKKLRTAGELSDFVAAAIGARPGATVLRPCLGAMAFRAVRRELVRLTAADPRTIRPETSMEQFLSSTERPGAWRRLSKRLGLRLPGLKFHPAARLVPPGVLLLGLVFWAAFGSDVLLLSGFAGAVFTAVAIHVLEYDLGTHLPAGCETVGRVSARLEPKVLKDLLSSSAALSDQDVWQIVRSIVASTADVSPGEVTRDSHVRRDFSRC